MRKVVLLGIAAMVLAAVAVAIFDPDALSAPDADQQEEALTECLRAADLTTNSTIPPYNRLNRTPEWQVEVREDGRVIAYIHLFDFPEEAASFVREARRNAVGEDEWLTVKQRGPAAVELVGAAGSASAIRGCIDKAAKPPPDDK